MQITRVELRNIKNHADAEWTFLPGLIAICGPNGSGKTTIIEAIAWALFDQLDYKREDFVKRGQSKGQVSVSFISDLDEREYTVQRDTGGTYFAYDSATKARLAEQRNQVLPWLCQHIGVEPGTDLALLFRTTIGVAQGTFTNDFSLRPAERKRIFDHTLKVDEYRDASDRLRQTVRYIEAETIKTNLAIATAEGELKVYDQTRDDLLTTQQREADLREAHVNASTEQSRLTAEVSTLDELKRNVEEHRATSNTLKLKLMLTRDKLSSAQEAAEQARTAAQIVEAARPGYEAYVNAAQLLNDLEQRRALRDKLQVEMTAIERRQIQLSTRTDHYVRLLVEARSATEELASLHSAVEEQTRLESQIVSLRQGCGARDALKARLTNVDDELQRLRKRYAELAAELEKSVAQREVAERLPMLEVEHIQLESAISREEFRRQNQKVRQEQVDGLKRELARLTDQRSLVEHEVGQLEALVESASQLDQVSTSHRDQTSRLAQLRAELDRDTSMVNSLESGGICPLLTEKCLNLRPGESLDARFRENLVERRSEVARLESATSRLNVELSRAQEATAHLVRLPQLKAVQARLEEAITHQRRQIESADAEVVRLGSNVPSEDDFQAKRATLEAQMRTARAAQLLYQRADFLRVELEGIKERGKTQRDEREELAARLRDNLDFDANLKEAEAHLAVLGNPRARVEAIERQFAEAGQWRLIVAEAERESAEIAIEADRVSTSLSQYAQIESELDSTRAARVANEGDYRTFIANEQVASSAGRREADVLHIQAEVVSTEDSYNASSTEYARLSASYDSNLHNDMQVSLGKCRQQVTQLATQLEQAGKEVSRLETRVSRLDEVRDELLALRSEQDRLKRLGEATEFIRNTLLQAAPYITEAYLFSISHEANQLYREIAGRQDVTLHWTRDYEITLEEEGKERPFGNLSGGEQMAAALAIRLALLKELSEINLAFFDEPTSNLDEDRRRNLAQQIGRIKHFKQLFVVSHDDSFEAYTDQVVNLTEKQAADVVSASS